MDLKELIRKLSEGDSQIALVVARKAGDDIAVAREDIDMVKGCAEEHRRTVYEDGRVKIESLDEPYDGLNHRYKIVQERGQSIIKFQMGAPEEEGSNGLEDSDLLRVVLHRLECLNKEVPHAFFDQAMVDLSMAIRILDNYVRDRDEDAGEGECDDCPGCAVVELTEE
jgi:hypothetical protein